MNYRMVSGIAVLAAALASGCAPMPYGGGAGCGWPDYCGTVPQPAPAPWPPIIMEPVRPEPVPEPQPIPPVAQQLPLRVDPPAPINKSPGTKLPPVGPEPPPPPPPAGEDDACVEAWRICHFL